MWGSCGAGGGTRGRLHTSGLAALIVSFGLAINVASSNLFLLAPFLRFPPALRARVFSETDSDYVCEDAEYNAIGPACWRSELEPLMLFLQRWAWWGGRCLCGLIIRTQWSCCHQPCHLQLKRHDCVLGAFSSLARSPAPPPQPASLLLGRFALNRSNFPRAMKSRNSS